VSDEQQLGDQANYDQGCDVQCCSNDVDATETMLCTCQLVIDYAPVV
jgi:hypothetical protein